MSILASDLKFYLSGGASNTDPNAALGGAISSTEITDNTLNNLFDNVSGTEHTAGYTDYRCFYVKNNSAETAYNSKIYIYSNTTGVESSIQIGLDLSGLDGTADTIPNETTAPDPAVTFSNAQDYANGLSLGDMTAGSHYAIWVKRVITAGSTAQANDTAVLTYSIDTV